MTEAGGTVRTMEASSPQIAHTHTRGQVEAAVLAVRPALTVRDRALVIDTLSVVLSSIIFFTLCMYRLDLPGLYNDEAFDVIPAMQIVLGHPVELQRGVGLHLFGVDLPLMSSSDYQGVTSTYLAIPFFALGGVSVQSLRLMTVLVGVAGVVVAFFLARSWFGPTAARLTALMLAVSPSWVFFSRVGVYVVSEVMPLAAGALLAFTIWVRSAPGRRNLPLYVGALLTGLGLTTKLLFIWFITAVAVLALLFYGRRVWEGRRVWWGRRWHVLRVAVLTFAAFCIGAFPFLLYNLLTRGTYYLIRDALTNLHSTAHGVDNTAILRNLWTKADAFKVLLDGGYFWFQSAQGHPYFNLLTPTVFAVSAVGLVYLTLSARYGTPRRVIRPTAEWSGGAVSQAVLLVLALLVSALLAWGILPANAPTLGVGVLCALDGVGVSTVRALKAHSGGTGGSAEGGAVIADTYQYRGWTAGAAAWALSVVAVLAGAIWWFGGAGRPDGPAPGALFGLWPVDVAGALFWLCGLGLVLVLGVDRYPVPGQRVVVAALAITGLIVAQSAITISGLWSTHLLILLPLPQMVVAAFATAVLRRVPAVRLDHWHWRNPGTGIPGPVSRVLRLTVVLVLTVLVSLDLLVDWSYHADLARTGGATTFSDAIYSLADYLQAQPPGTHVVAMDWGFRRPIQLLTQERVDPVEAFGLQNPAPPSFYQTLRSLLAQPDTLYLFHTREGAAYPRHDAFFAEVAAAGKHAVLVSTFYHRDGKPVYEVYTVR